MGRYIIKLHGYYLEWSTVVDAPVTFGMSPDEFRQHYRDEYGRQGAQDLEDRLARVETKGTSSRVDPDLTSCIDNNRAGPDGACLTADEIYRAYCLREPIRDGWRVPVVEEAQK